jgi:hypothetical protein
VMEVIGAEVSVYNLQTTRIAGRKH